MTTVGGGGGKVPRSVTLYSLSLSISISISLSLSLSLSLYEKINASQRNTTYVLFKVFKVEEIYDYRRCIEGFQFLLVR